MSDRFVQIPWAKATSQGDTRILQIGGNIVSATESPSADEALNALEVSLNNGPLYSFDSLPQWIDEKEQILIPDQRTFNIPEMFLDKAEKKLKKLNRVAAKLNLPKLRMHTLRTYIRKFLDREAGRHFSIKYLEIYIEGDAPRLSGYTFLAKVEHGAHGNFIDTAPGVEMDLSTKREADNFCDHCGTRRERKDTFLLFTPDEKIVQVGRNCLADFIRGANPTNLVAYWRELNSFGELEEEPDVGSSGGRDTAGFEPMEVLEYAARAIDRFGWVSKTAAQNQDKSSTASYVMFAIQGFRPTPGMSATERAKLKEHWDSLQPIEEDTDTALATMEWIVNQPSGSEYLYKLQLILKDDFVAQSRAALLISAVGSYLREQDRLKTEERKQAKMLNEPFGVVGTRYDMKLEVVRVRGSEGIYGYTTIIAFQDIDGRQYTWFAIGDKTREFEEGMFVAGKATIKKHDQYKGIAQTHITRAKFKELEK